MLSGQTQRTESLHDDLRDLDLLRWSLSPRLDGQRFEHIQHIFASDKLAEDGVLLVEVRRGAEGDVELRAVCAGSLVCHSENSSLVVLGSIAEVIFVPERCAPTGLPTSAGPCWVSCLDLVYGE